jgi:hypothetical protein
MPMLRLRVVIYQEDGLMVAHSLEVDVIGVGTTQTAALEELRGNIEAQLSFSRAKKINPFRPAPAKIQALWDDNNLSILGLPGSKSRSAPVRNTRVLEWSKSQVSRLKGKPLELV